MKIDNYSPYQIEMPKTEQVRRVAPVSKKDIAVDDKKN